MLKKYWIIAGMAFLTLQLGSCENEMEEIEEEEEVSNNTGTDTSGTDTSGNNTNVAYCDTASPSYSNTVKAIVDANCATSSGCHGNGGSFGVFTTFSGLNAVVGNDKFKQRVITQKNMPPSGPLSDELIEKLQCWLDKGAPEN